MTTASLSRIEQLAESAYSFATDRLEDHITPIFEFMQSLNLDRETYMKLENEVSGAICGAEHKAFVGGFVFGQTIANVPLFSTDPMDAVLMPDRYVGQ